MNFGSATYKLNSDVYYIYSINSIYYSTLQFAPTKNINVALGFDLSDGPIIKPLLLFNNISCAKHSVDTILIYIILTSR